jgi:uncharacterized lipoprotein YddW (UPF0748 family)
MLDTCTDGYVTLSPGVPEVREHLRSVAEDLLSAYAVDGLHLDYIRYPGPGYSYDPLGEEAYAIDLQARPGLAHADWQREQVDDSVRQVFETLLQVRPAATLSAAVWFVYRNEWGWSSVSEGYPDYYQDPRAWTAAGTVDALAPMIYFPLTDPPGGRLDFYTLLQDHLQGNPGRFVLAGIKADYPDFSEIAAQIAAVRELQAAGFILFAYSNLVDRDTFDDLAAGPLSEPAAVPRRPWRP